MGFLTDSEGKKRSTFLLFVFLLTLLYIGLYFLSYFYLAEPLYTWIHFNSELWTTFVHAGIISLVGTLVCCLAFLLPDKKMAPCGFAGVAFVFCLFLVVSLLRNTEDRLYMLKMICMYGAGPSVIGNLISWPVYHAFVRHGYEKPKAKTLEQEIREQFDTKAKKP